MPERVYYDARRHGVVLARPLARAYLAAAVGSILLALPWPVPVFSPLLIGLGAAMALSAVWRWDRTRVVVTQDKVVLVQGVVRQRARGVRLEKVEAVEVEQSVLGRVFGYGTLVAGALEVEYVPQPRELADLLG
jgi:uncharacterized membrane protein YdbT with pleckstrin-like domain